MKKVISLLISFVMLLSVTAGVDLSAYADTATSGKCGDSAYWNYDEDTKTLTISGTGMMDNYFDSEDTPWYGFCRHIKKISIGYNITSIGESAFEDCSSLTSVTIPNGVTSIGRRAFDGCTSLTSVTIGTSVKSIGYCAFLRCSSLISVRIPDSVITIDDSSFIGCDSLVNIDVDTNNKCYSSVSGVLFNKNKTNLINYPAGNNRTLYTIPNSVTSIGDYAFYGSYRSSSLTGLTIPNSVTSIGNTAFGACSNLTSLIIPNSVTRIGECAFHACYSLTSVTIPDSVTSIGFGAFNGCSSLASVTIPNSVTSILGDVFSGCENLTSVMIPCSVKNIREGAFKFCSNLTDVYYSGTEEQWKKVSIDHYDVNDNRFLLQATIHYNFVPCSENKHNYKQTIVEPTCTTQGHTIYTCTECGYTYKSDFVTTVEHSFKDYKYNNDATCTADGTQTATCEYGCGTQNTITALNTAKGHKFVDNEKYCINGCKTLNPNYKDSSSGDGSTGNEDNKPTPGDPSGGSPMPAPAPDNTNKDDEQKPEVKPAQPTNQNTKTDSQKPVTVTLSKTQAKKNTVVVYWNPVKNVTGYQLQVATDKKFKKNKKTFTIKGKNKKKKTVKNLKSKKKFYTRVRTYKIVNGKKVY
ncbi:MAG: leucine-rich repeat domain-containing protein, partial [Clostridia bacterium]|nr:leucine-rich repeat domain-containing protein [Clostridia bacterium]